MKFSCYAQVIGSKYLGDVEADSLEEAEEKADELETLNIGLCHQCADQVEDPTITEIVVYPA